MNFENLNLNPSIMAGVRELGYTELTPIQEKAIPPGLAGKDIIGLAQTGTGKTAAFVLPVLQHLVAKPQRKISVAVITPTRELAEQINASVNSLGKHTGIRSISIYGGENIEAQVRELRKGVNIIVACPGRLLDHLWRGSIDLSHLDILVIDEADRMLDMGFLPEVKKILQCLMKRRQTLLFSATMPEDIRKLAKEILTNPVTIQVGQTAPAVTVSHALYPVKQHLKTALLTELLPRLESKSVLVFARTKHRTERLASSLKARGFRTASLQGDLSQAHRQAALDSFRRGTIKILVATDIMSRGIDILRISHVINYDMPATTEDYIHRIGRTGRVNNTGEALTFVTDDDNSMVVSIERILKKNIERRTLEGFDYSKPAPERTAPGRNRISTPGGYNRPTHFRKVTVAQT